LLEAYAFPVVEAAFKEFALPKAIHTDNSVPFANPNALFGLSKPSVFGWQRSRCKDTPCLLGTTAVIIIWSIAFSRSERTVKNWSSASSGPGGQHLITLAHHSDPQPKFRPGTGMRAWRNWWTRGTQKEVDRQQTGDVTIFPSYDR